MDIETTPGYDHAAIAALVRGLDPIDEGQMRLTASLSPADRVLAGMRAQAFAMALLRGTFSRRFPNRALSELNMKVLAHFTLLRRCPPREANPEDRRNGPDRLYSH